MDSEDVDAFEKSRVMEAFKEENIQYISRKEWAAMFPPGMFDAFLEAEQIEEDLNE